MPIPMVLWKGWNPCGLKSNVARKTHGFVAMQSSKTYRVSLSNSRRGLRHPFTFACKVTETLSKHRHNGRFAIWLQIKRKPHDALTPCGFRWLLLYPHASSRIILISPPASTIRRCRSLSGSFVSTVKPLVTLRTGMISSPRSIRARTPSIANSSSWLKRS